MDVIISKDIGRVICAVRKALGVTQDQLALTSGTNRRFVIELERGKATSQIGKVMQVLRTLGIGITLVPPLGVDIADHSVAARKAAHGKTA